MMKLLAYLLVVANVVFALYMLLTPAELKVEVIEGKKGPSFSNLMVGEKKPIDKSGIKPVKIIEVEVCFAVDLIKTKDEALQVQQRLVSLGLRSELASSLLVNKVNYWLLLGPFDSDKRAKTEAKDLASRDIDSYVIPSGEYAHAVSLGVMSILCIVLI